MVEILYEQGPCLVVNKPPGILTQAPPGIDSLETRIKEFLKAREGKPGNVYLGVPHRLDRPASGAIVFARHVRATRRLAEQFEGRVVDKRYWAIVSGRVSPEQGTWRDYVIKVPGEARAAIVAPGDPAGRSAVLHYRVIRADDAMSWLEIELETGRTHQVRLQAASRGFAVLGDELYGSTQIFGPPVDDPRQRAIALHARRLRFRHPVSQEWVDVSAEVPAIWGSLAPREEGW